LHSEKLLPNQRTVSQQQPGRFLIGYADDLDQSEPATCGDFIVDDMQFWFADRKTLLAFDYIARGPFIILFILLFSLLYQLF
jgi:hypothetical protein